MCVKCKSTSALIWEKKTIEVGDKQGTYKDLNYHFCDDCGEVYFVSID